MIANDERPHNTAIAVYYSTFIGCISMDVSLPSCHPKVAGIEL